jgi:hypothetical protein
MPVCSGRFDTPCPLRIFAAVHRPLLAAFAALICLSPFGAKAQQDAPQKPPPSIVYFAHDPNALDEFEENPAVTRRMVDQVVIGVTGQTDIAAAWRSLVTPRDRIGIKVSATGGRDFASHHGIVEAIVKGLEAAGIPRAQVIVWDRDADDLAAARFTSQRGGYKVRSIFPALGYDLKAPFSAPVLGRLIWGDARFQEKQKQFGKVSEEADQLSSTSYFSSVLTRDVTKIINVPVFSDEAGCGVAGALYNLTVPNLDNWRRFTQQDGAASIPDIYADDHIRPKVVINIMDALLAQYAGGPRFNPNYVYSLRTIYASKDPVAIDATVFRLIEKWRKEVRLKSIEKLSAWLPDCEEMGLGNFAESRITLQQVSSK